MVEHALSVILRLALIGIILYVAFAYFVLPVLWRHFEHDPKFAGLPKITRTREGIPGDPLNVSLIGTEEELVNALARSGWYPADSVTFISALKAAGSILLGRPYPDAPVSSLYLWGRREDLAFEQAAGRSPRERHHVRFWRSPESNGDGRPLWMGAATFDRGVGFSHFTGQVTHHIAPDIDSERDTLIADIKRAGLLEKVYQVSGVAPALNRTNGGGDRYFTDGEVTVGVLTLHRRVRARPPAMLPNPPAVRFKNRLWSRLRAPLSPGLETRRKR